MEESFSSSTLRQIREKIAKQGASPMKLEVGKYYRTRDGRKVKIVSEDGHYRWPFNGDNGDMYNEYGGWGETGIESRFDLIAEWTDTPEPCPVRTVTTTRQEIVPGVYGRVGVERVTRPYVHLFFSGDSMLDSEELTEAIATLTAIRDAMQADATA